MKKILTTLTISLLWSNIVLAKISDEYYEVLYEGCMTTAKKKNRSPSITKRYCICSADYIDKRFTDDSLDKLANAPNSKNFNNLVKNISNFCNREVGFD
tara:strand:- start:117 stop:413 length:297 start_codon:yes stop_codon:yes gene_type:complete